MRRTVITTAVVSLLVLLGATVASAETLSPWWHITSSTAPTYIQPGQATDELQRLTVSANAGTYELRGEGVEAGSLDRSPGLTGLASGVARYISPAVGEKPEQLQAELEGVYGEHNLEVTSPCTATPNPACPKSLNAYEVYEVKFVERLANASVLPIHVESRGLSGGTEKVADRQVAVGRPDGTIVVTATNLGDASPPTECVNVGAGGGRYADPGCTDKVELGEGEFEARLKQPITIKDMLPPGLTPVTIEGVANVSQELKYDPIECSKTELSCTFTGTPPSFVDGYDKEYYEATVSQARQIQMRIGVDVTGASTGESNAASIAGGETPAATVKTPLTISTEPIPFGVSSYELRPEEAGGSLDTRAGSHPFQVTTALDFNQNAEGQPVAMAKDLHFQLPPGLIGDPTPFPQCPLATFLQEGGQAGHPECPADTVVGFTTGSLVIIDNGNGHTQFSFEDKVFNVEPAAGEPARFAFMADTGGGLVPLVPVYLNTSVRTGGDYGVTVSTHNISQIAEFVAGETVFWGVPGDARHGVDTESHPPPLLSMPTTCSGLLHTTVEAASWLQPTAFQSLANTEPVVALDGCNRLPFVPEIKVSPDSQQASKPTGLTVDVHVPQEGQLNPEGLAQSNVRNITVALPQGVAIDPSGGDGLEACSASAGSALDGHLGIPGDEIGFEGFRNLSSSPVSAIPRSRRTCRAPSTRSRPASRKRWNRAATSVPTRRRSAKRRSARRCCPTR